MSHYCQLQPNLQQKKSANSASATGTGRTTFSLEPGVQTCEYQHDNCVRMRKWNILKNSPLVWARSSFLQQKSVLEGVKGLNGKQTEAERLKTPLPAFASNSSKVEGKEGPLHALGSPIMELLTLACRDRPHISFHTQVSRDVQTATRKREKSHWKVDSVAPAFPWSKSYAWQ